MVFGSIDVSDNLGTYKDSIGRPYTLIRKPANPTNDPRLEIAGASLLLEQGSQNYGSIQFGGVLSSQAGGGSVSVGGGSFWAGRAPTRQNIPANYYPLGMELGVQAPISGANHAFAITAYGGIKMMSFTALGEIRDAGGAMTLNSSTLGTGVINSSLTSVGNLTSLTVNGNVSVKPASNLLRINTVSENIGIGVATPEHKLDVSGNINVSNSYKILGQDVLTSTTLASSVVNSSLTSLGTLSTLNVTNDINTGILRFNNPLDGSPQNLAIINGDGAPFDSTPVLPGSLYLRTAGEEPHLYVKNATGWTGVSAGEKGDPKGEKGDPGDTPSLDPLVLDTVNGWVGIGKTPTSTLDIVGDLTVENQITSDYVGANTIECGSLKSFTTVESDSLTTGIVNCDGVLLKSTNVIAVGEGAPTTPTAAPGSLFMRTDGTQNLYVKGSLEWTPIGSGEKGEKGDPGEKGEKGDPGDTPSLDPLVLDTVNGWVGIGKTPTS
ncbi:MAG: hypothetical protein EBU96_09870, partial [Actinobacteria bacterium]|nr:hypothetical protein [Actinomycetota bacterium]